jgi:hypothetical protein
MPEDLELDETEPEVTRLYGGAVALGRALRGAFPTRRRAFKWQFFGHQGFPWCPECGVMVAGAAPYHRDRRRLSPGQVAHERHHEWLAYMASVVDQAAEVLGIELERDDSGAESDPAPRGDSGS